MEVSQLQEAWTRTIIPAVEERGGIPTASLLREAHPADLSDDTLTLEFPPSAQFHLDLARDPKNTSLLADALYDVTGRRLELVFELGEAREAAAPDGSRRARSGSSSSSRRHSTRASGKARGMSSFDMEKLMQQAAQMQEQVQRMQDEAEQETAQSSVGGGLVKVTANGAGEVIAIEISPDAIDPADPEALADLVLAGVNEALRSARASVEAKAQQMLGDMGLGDLGLPGLGE